MIGKISKGRSFSGLLDYLFKAQEKERPEREASRDKERAELKTKEQELERALDDRQRVETDHSKPTRADKEKPRNGEIKEQDRGNMLMMTSANRGARLSRGIWQAETRENFYTSLRH